MPDVLTAPAPAGVGPAARPAPRPSAVRRIGLLLLGLVVLATAAAGVHMARMMARPAPPPDVGTEKATVNGRYRVLLAAEPSPVPLQRLHRWTARVEPAGAPGTGGPGALTLTVDGGMPQHGHGLPTQPRVTGRLPDGRLVIDGIKFSMPGWWELRLRVAGPAGVDSVTFNLTL